ncbi:MAG TPA: cysteine peptidase family C39 domain-containing protein [Nitrospiria bacterium]|nr:cysteine peptidase family C39 domain-containing protein [Nitrospiria bacterium]
MRRHRIRTLIAGLGLASAFWVIPAPAGASPPGPGEAVHITVPFFAQEDQGCGPAALASVLAYLGHAVSLEELTEEMVHPKLKGTLPMDLEYAARKRGLRAESFSGGLEDLHARMREKQPVIAFVNLLSPAFPKGHFVVVTGYDREAGIIIAHNGKKRDEAIPVKKFIKAWKKTDYWTLALQSEERS